MKKLNFQKLKSLAGKNWQIIALIVSLILLILSYVGCGTNKSEVKDLAVELDECRALLVACDTAKFELITINAKNESLLRDVELPQPLIVETGEELQLLREQIQRNKLKQVVLTGNCLSDSLEFQARIKERDQEIDKIYNLAQLKSDTISFLIAQLNKAKRKRFYQDSIKEENYSARYSIQTTGTLDSLKLAVDPKTVLVQRTIQAPAPPAEHYRYKNNLKLTYSPYSTWDTKYELSQKAGIEYEHDAGAIGFRLNGNYLIEAKDYEAAATVYLKPFRWGKKTK